MREKGKSLVLTLLIALLLVSATIMNIQRVGAETPTVYVDPPTVINSGLTPGQNFTVNIRIANVTEMWSYRVDLWWGPTILDVPDNPGTPGVVEGVTEGPFLQFGGDTVFVTSLDQTEGTLSVSGSLKAPYGVHQNGTGILFSVKFTVEQVAATVLVIYYSRILVKGPPPQYLPTPTEHTSEDGFFSNVIGGTYDIAVANVTSKIIVIQGETVDINVTVENQGSILEGFAVRVYFNSSLIEIGMTALSNGASTTLVFDDCDTEGLDIGVYTLSANASIVSGETDTADNSYTDGTIKLTKWGDVKAPFGVINILDIVLVALSFDLRKGDPGYNPIADVNNNDWVNILDVVQVALHFDDSYDWPL